MQLFSWFSLLFLGPFFVSFYPLQNFSFLFIDLLKHQISRILKNALYIDSKLC